MLNYKNLITEINGGVTAPEGFIASGVSSGIKKDGRPDLALVCSRKKCSAAGIFTLNRIKGHSLKLCSENISDGSASCVFINSGNANACVGQEGFRDAKRIAEICAENLKISPHEVLTASTGVIGYRLPMEKIANGIEDAAVSLSKDRGSDAANAIMTTDTFKKEYSLMFHYKGKEIKIGGMAKGSGMIHPNMATMISVITTDAYVEPSLLKEFLTHAANVSFNRISVDGETSVCDSVMMLANGLSGCTVSSDDADLCQLFLFALEMLCKKLARDIVSDGEGATKLIEVNVLNAPDSESALSAAKAVANSPLVKTAINGEDANWGRILTAIGYSGADFNPETTKIFFDDLVVFSNGKAVEFNEETASRILSRNEITINIDFGNGNFSDTVWTCDFSHGYIDINAHYRT